MRIKALLSSKGDEQEKLLDISLLQGYLDSLGASIVEKMRDLYIQQSTLYLKEITLAVEAESQVNWQEACHKMKGAAGSVGLLLVHQQLVLLEKSTEEWGIKEADVSKLIALNH